MATNNRSGDENLPSPHNSLFRLFFCSSCFQTPIGRRAEREEALAVVDGAETATAGLGLVLSSVGLRAGIQAPPELAQAVLEGVFWCRCGRLLFWYLWWDAAVDASFVIGGGSGGCCCCGDRSWRRTYTVACVFKYLRLAACNRRKKTDLATAIEGLSPKPRRAR